MKKDKTISAVLLIAGSSNRFGGITNKNLEKINDKYIFWYSLEVFNNCKYIDNIFIVVKEEEKEHVTNILSDFNFKKDFTIVVRRK